MRISDWSSDVCSSDLNDVWQRLGFSPRNERSGRGKGDRVLTLWWRSFGQPDLFSLAGDADDRPVAALDTQLLIWGADGNPLVTENLLAEWVRSEEHTSELQSLMRISYAVFCLQKRNNDYD